MSVGQPQFNEGDKVIINGVKATVVSQILENHTDGAVWGQVYATDENGGFIIAAPDHVEPA
jgi:hypothetical protein